MVRDKRYKRLITISRLLFVAYMVFALYFLLFAETFGRGSINREYSYNLELFREIRRYMEWSSKSQLGMKMMFLNIWGNIIIFMPFGFFIPTVVKKAKNIVIVTILSFVFSEFRSQNIGHCKPFHCQSQILPQFVHNNNCR